MKLRQYQREDYRLLSKSLKTNPHTLFGAATGYGKSAIIHKLVKKTVKSGGRVLVILPRRKLVKQMAETLSSFYPSIVMANDGRYDPTLSVQVCSTSTLHRRLLNTNFGKIDLVIIDEVHINFSSASMSRVVEKYWGSSKWVGLSATPIDNRGYRLEGWDNTIYEHQSKRLIKEGWLVKTKVMVEDTPDNLDTVKISAGDYNESDLESLMLEGGRVTNIYDIWEKYCKKRKTMIFAVTINHAEMIRKDFMKHGIDSAISHSKMSEDDEEVLLSKFSNDELRVLINVSKLTTGFDETGVDALIIARPTKSLRLFLQIIGRALRLHKGKKNALILDVAGTIKEHGYPTMLRDFNKVKPPPREKANPTYEEIVCEDCNYSTQLKNCTRKIKENKSFTRTRWYCPNCGSILKEILIDNKEVKRMRKIKDISNVDKVRGKDVSKFVEKIRVINHYKSGWYIHVKRNYEKSDTFRRELKILYKKWKLKMVNDKTAALNINKLSSDVA